MPVLVAGSIATDHLMHFPGKFSDQLLADHLHKVSLSFLVDELVIKRGGVAPNICYAMAQLGGAPVLVGAVGEDFAEYRSFLEDHGVDCSHVHVSDTQHTARFVCTTDTDMNQIGSFYAGAMAEAAQIEIAPIWDATGADLAVISAYDPAAMVQHSEECRREGPALRRRPVAADHPHGRRAAARAHRGRRPAVHQRLRATSCSSPRPGYSTAEIDERGQRPRHHARQQGRRDRRRDFGTVHTPVAKERSKADPTGVGDAFRGGFLTAREWGLDWDRAAEVGSLLATMVLETVGTQEYTVTKDEFGQRLAESYGDDCAAEILPHLR